ncbi:hypothetical protein CQW23_16291 [Capsicum baccatum]|uniref:Knottins-like domain-containing protein n=1 Tax=Capsicum baccatum TaxID=33114 RepID=A0A2G2WAJ4_CAPBA|nr:hypothetical protein CQW23_16291 [Capsicum baccatum]
MARSIYFISFLVLAITLFVANGVQGSNICKTTSKYYRGRCTTDSSCRKVCIEKDKFEGGQCTIIKKNCLCNKQCVCHNIPKDARTILVQDAKTLEAELLEEEIFKA